MSNEAPTFPEVARPVSDRIAFRLPKGLNKLLLYVLLLLLCIPFVFPFWWMVISSFKTPNEIFAYPPSLIPRSWQWQNFVETFRYQPFARHYFNSVYIAVLTTAGTLVVSSLAGYAFARIRFRGDNFLFLLLLSSLMMPLEVTIIPNFFLMKALNLLNTHVPLIIIPVLGGQGVVATFIMRQYFLSLPKEIEDAGTIDGLSRFGIWRHIALPMARSALAAVAILTFLDSWNSFLEPLIYIDDLNLFTLPLSLRNYMDITGLPLYHLQLAATTLSVVPILIIYIVAQRHVINSFALSGVKG